MNLNDLREEIDIIDTQIINLLAERFKATTKIGLVKKEQALNNVDHSRYNSIIEQWRNLATENNLNPDLLEKIFINIHEQVIIDHQKIKLSNQ